MSSPVNSSPLRVAKMNRLEIVVVLLKSTLIGVNENLKAVITYVQDGKESN